MKLEMSRSWFWSYDSLKGAYWQKVLTKKKCLHGSMIMSLIMETP